MAMSTCYSVSPSQRCLTHSQVPAGWLAYECNVQVTHAFCGGSALLGVQGTKAAFFYNVAIHTLQPACCLQDRPSLRYVRDVLRMRSSNSITLRFLEVAELLQALEAAGELLLVQIVLSGFIRRGRGSSREKESGEDACSCGRK